MRYTGQTPSKRRVESMFVEIEDDDDGGEQQCHD